MPSAWRPSVNPGGTPRNSDAIAFSGGDLLDYAVVEIAVELGIDGVPEFVITTRPGADDVSVTAEWSEDLEDWKRQDLFQESQTPLGGGLGREVWRLAGATPRELFLRSAGLDPRQRLVSTGPGTAPSDMITVGLDAYGALLRINSNSFSAQASANSLLLISVGSSSTSTSAFSRIALKRASSASGS